jgi:NAD(P)-dependent dehydrogenase (short-subunit alcohol dehydrogenase family)
LAHSEVRPGSEESGPTDLFDPRGKVAFIPGGYGGIGQAIASELASRGASVAIAGRHPDRAASAARELNADGHRAIGFALDVRRPGELRDAVTHVADEFGGVAPTFVRTELVRAYLEDPDFRSQLEARIPLGRIAEPRDIADPVAFFVSPAAGFVTGRVLFVDGGITASQ